MICFDVFFLFVSLFCLNINNLLYRCLIIIRPPVEYCKVRHICIFAVNLIQILFSIWYFLISLIKHFINAQLNNFPPISFLSPVHISIFFSLIFIETFCILIFFFILFHYYDFYKLYTLLAYFCSFYRRNLISIFPYLCPLEVFIEKGDLSFGRIVSHFYLFLNYFPTRIE